MGAAADNGTTDGSLTCDVEGKANEPTACAVRRPHASRGYHQSKINHYQNQLLGIDLWTLWMILIGILKSFIELFLRYGNPDSQNLGTLRNKIQIYKFLGFLSNTMRSDFIFRVELYF